jgi:pilus assembly protein CpaF
MSLADRLANATPNDQVAQTRIAETRNRIQERLVETLGPRLYDAALSDSQLEGLVQQHLRELLDEEESALSAQEKLVIVRQIGDSVLGLGPLEPFARDPDVTEIMVNSWDSIYVERAGKIYWTGAKFRDDVQLRQIIDKIVARVGRRVDETSPYVDARLPDGSRVNAVIPPLAIDGACLTIRKFSADPYGADDLISFGTLTGQTVELLDACVRGRMNILVSGGTGAGKTTTLNVLSSFLPDDERILTIEDSAELRLQQPHVVRLEYRPPNIEGPRRGHDPGPGPQRPAHAAGQDRGRRGPWRRGPGHDAGHEHRSRRVDHDRPLELAARRVVPLGDDDADGRDGPRDPSDQGTGRLGPQSDRPPDSHEGRRSPDHPRH